LGEAGTVWFHSLCCFVAAHYFSTRLHVTLGPTDFWDARY